MLKNKIQSLIDEWLPGLTKKVSSTVQLITDVVETTDNEDVIYDYLSDLVFEYNPEFPINHLRNLARIIINERKRYFNDIKMRSV